MFWTRWWDVVISLGFALEPWLLWSMVQFTEHRSNRLNRVRRGYKIAAAAVALLVFGTCWMYPRVQWVLLIVLVGYGLIYMRGSYPMAGGLD